MKHISKLFTLLLVFCMVLSICSCSGDADKAEETSNNEETTASDTEKDTETEEIKTATFDVKVVDENGDAVAGVMIQVCKDSCIPAKTDDNGVATFNIEITDGYKLSVLSCPEGYEYTGEAEIYLDSGITEYTVEIIKVA